MQEFIDRSAEDQGTPINRKTMMAVQGFQTNKIEFIDGSIVETNSEGHTKTTVFSESGILERFSGEKTIYKRTTFHDDGTISEEVR